MTPLPDWAALDPRLPALLERFGAPVCSPEPQWEETRWVHITAAARVWNPKSSAFLQRWSSKARAWQLLGAHGEGDFDLRAVARREAAQALGVDALRGGQGVEVRVHEVEEYWNTPAHWHFEVVFEFWLDAQVELPRALRWSRPNNAVDDQERPFNGL